ncbi:227_t:CDS:1 [Funneliformis geosporum]|uniref:Succinate dehydrogenase assembly factor 2, mitochondrial n=1 Tax=Funneliformis geosporum TaxID=1117311 RepID=A0A9W4SZS2_9GLOM|nr:227_t:CDS:1 [Funneliformis geosporum]CAI2187486.1 19133_t:CDS:1 [Funneliformis geosporum]
MASFTMAQLIRYNKIILFTQSLTPIKPLSTVLLRYNSSITNSNANSPTIKKVVDDSKLLPYQNLPPISRPNESLEQKRSRLLYQSRKRGILETDLLLSTFANKYLKGFTEGELKEYDELLDVPDWDIYYFSTNKKPIPSKWENNSVFNKFKQHVKNKGKVILRMPDL